MISSKRSCEDAAVLSPITAEQLLFVLMVCPVCIGAAHVVHGWMEGTGILLPLHLAAARYFSQPSRHSQPSAEISVP